ncbi:type VI secretion system protein TssA [uncultured Shewanella sp.]|uniref:type VI secretion system protein TssA n=1 Tax=uncultured Shewanella sp. TaxID=173975 RepID=UPI002627DCD1|nr:type VI secretion system protein TssA [uncultured Shewanella sp.]
MSKEYLTKITQPISADNAVGERLFDDPLFDFIESQMIKVGSLSHGDIQWREVETGIVTLLETKSKDLKLIAYLLQCLQHQASIERFTLSLLILHGFMQGFWESCFPAPGARGVLPRRRFFTQIMQRLVKAAENLDTEFCDQDEKQSITEALAALMAIAKQFELPLDELSRLESALKRRLSGESKPKQAAQTAELHASSSTQNTPQASTEGSSPTPPSLNIDSSNDKATKQTLQKVADFLSEFELGIELSLRLRRFAVWFSIISPPERTASGETRLMPVAVDRVNEYQTLLSKGADMALLRRVEQSLTLAPFWFDGHHLSAQICQSLGHSEWANAIREETYSFLNRVPGLMDMSFKGAVPFVSSETRQWLDSASGASMAGGEVMSSWEQKRQETLELADQGGLSVALAMLNEGMSSTKEPREQFYLRLISAELMDSHQLSAMAKVEYHQLHTQAMETSLTDWEPTLVSHLQKVTSVN